MNFYQRLIFSCLLFTSSTAFALEIDEKLTLRFLKVSNSKKTVLINRGSEDGLVVNDHAKFFITQGVVARGVVVKVSPSRSIWSIYRVVDSEVMQEGKVLNLKISTPVKLTEDPSKSLKSEGIEAGNDQLNIPMADGADDLPKDLDSNEKNEMKDLSSDMDTETKKKNEVTTKNIFSDSPQIFIGNNPKNWEIFSSFYFSAVTGTVESEDVDSTEAKNSSLDLSVGIEKYFSDSSSEVLSNSSLMAFARLSSNETGASAVYSFKTTEFGLGANYHIFASPFAVQKIIGTLSFSAGLGSVTNESKSVVSNTVETETSSGSSTFFSFGAGMKYNFNRNWGTRLSFDYYISNASLEDENENTIELSQSGPRFNIGFNYSF